MINKPKFIRYNRDFQKDLFKDVRVPKNIGLKKCIQCGNCSSACPAARYTSFRPRKFIYDILIGRGGKILESEDIWQCFSCFSCNLRCPRNNNPGMLIHIFRDLARSAGYGWEKVIPFKNYLISLRDTGLGITPLSTPITIFEQELGEEWANIRRNLPEILKQLGMNPVPPREIPQEARDQIKQILQSAGINEEIKKFEEMERKMQE